MIYSIPNLYCVLEGCLTRTRIMTVCYMHAFNQSRYVKTQHHICTRTLASQMRRVSNATCTELLLEAQLASTVSHLTHPIAKHAVCLLLAEIHYTRCNCNGNILNMISQIWPVPSMYLKTSVPRPSSSSTPLSPSTTPPPKMPGRPCPVHSSRSSKHVQCTWCNMV